MSKFLKLSNFLVNTNDIHKIVIKPNKYIIHITSKKIFGFIPGFISSYTSEVEVCEKKHSNDYKIISDWISKIE